MIISARILYAIIFYILALVIIYLNKPLLIFNLDGSVRPFGLNNKNLNETTFALGTFTVIISLFSFYFFAFIDYIFKY